jgi:ABC-type nitrate/sulfonate/bicarbonate transport system substrate-binding protein
LSLRQLRIPAACLLLALQSACTCETPTRLRVGMLARVGCSPLQLASEEKIFQRHGLELEFKTFAKPLDLRLAASQEGFDLFCANLAEVLVLPQDYQILLLPAVSEGADVLITRRDAGIELAELKGARIGIPPVSMGEILLAEALRQHTLAREDFTVLSMEAPDLREALAKSEIQMAIAAPPYSLELLKIPETTILFRSSALPGVMVDAIAARADLLQTKPLLTGKLEMAWQDTLQLMQKDPDASFSWLATQSGIPLHSYQQDYRFLTPTEQLAYLQPEGKLLPLIKQLQTSLVLSGSLKMKREPKSFLPIPTTK